MLEPRAAMPSARDREAVGALARIFDAVHGPTWPTATLKFTLVVDHVGKDKKRGIMGSIAKVANADVVLLLDVNKKNGTVTSSRMILHMMRGGAAGTVNDFSLKPTPENEHGDSFIIVDWHGIEQINLSCVCNLLLRSLGSAKILVTC